MFLAWEKVVEQPHPDGHLVQIYKEDDDAALVRNVSRFLSEGVKNGDAALVVANARHAQAFRKAIGPQADAIRFLDSVETLSRLMRDEQPDWNRFKEIIGGAVTEMRSASAAGGLRAYGDMVNLLWKARQYSSAIRLEQFWNRLLSRSSFTRSESRIAGFSLYCAYSMDVLADNFQAAALEGILATHTHLIPGSNGQLKAAIDRAMDDVLGKQVEEVREQFKRSKAGNDRPSRAVVSSGESIALWLRRWLPERADEIFERARNYYRENEV